ncbi:pupal cuticle protein 27-like [Bombyx mandarina]|nr:pupal cuticle protein 27-like [Bombyx mandarina]
MYLLITVAVLAVSHAAKLDKTYLPPHSQSSGGSGSFLQTPFVEAQRQAQLGSAAQNGFARAGNGFAQPAFGGQYSNGYDAVGVESRPERPRAALERNAAILRQDNTNNGDSYSYAYETENGIYAEENGVAANGVEAQGGYSYTGDDGQVYTIRYTADQNGFVAQGDHIPTAPPVPEEILRALEQNARDEAAGIYDDGSYSEEKYGGGEARLNKQYADSVVTDSAAYRDVSGLRTQASFRNGPQTAYLPPAQRRQDAGYHY